jgi:hypothetical protein
MVGYGVSAPAGDDGVGRLAEEERQLAVAGRRPSRGHARRKLAADAVDAAHREGAAAGDGNGGDGRRGDNEIGHAWFSDFVSG